MKSFGVFTERDYVRAIEARARPRRLFLPRPRRWERACVSDVVVIQCDASAAGAAAAAGAVTAAATLTTRLHTFRNSEEDERREHERTESTQNTPHEVRRGRPPATTRTANPPSRIARAKRTIPRHV